MASFFRLAALGALVALAGCRFQVGAAPPQNKPVELAYWAVDNLLDQLVDQDCLGRLLVATLVDINAVNETSMFGRQVSECLSARLTQRDVDVIHATIRQDHMLIRHEGQFLLSREIRNLAADHNAKTVLVGTYGTTKDYVLVSLKLVSTVDDSTLAAFDYWIDRTGATQEMLATWNRTW
jgi:TolB-like protein